MDGLERYITIRPSGLQQNSFSERSFVQDDKVESGHEIKKKQIL